MLICSEGPRARERNSLPASKTEKLARSRLPYRPTFGSSSEITSITWRSHTRPQCLWFGAKNPTFWVCRIKSK